MFLPARLQPASGPCSAMQASAERVRQTTIPTIKIAEGRYLVRFARTREEIDAALKLRFEIFNMELGEGLASSFHIGRDLDEFDEFCHHLIILDMYQNQIVGTYRMQTYEMASTGNGFYSAYEFDFTHFPSNVLTNGVELGRACIAESHRNTQALLLLWKGLAAYVAHNRKRYLFGCCSLTSQDALEGQQVLALLKEQGHLHPSLFMPPRARFICEASNVLNSGSLEAARIPKLFRTYLRYGAKVCSAPAIDRRFKTIDFLFLFDSAEMTAIAAKLLFRI
jgi:putative hemolysin